MPQGSVLGPLLILMYIQDLGEDINQTIMDILKFVDDSKIIAEVNDENDIEILQLNLEKIYSWADKNYMKWNAKKFQLLRVGPI